jgi:fatty-acyl-CoA synthase
VGGWLARRAALTGERIAVIETDGSEERRLRYADLEERCQRAAAWLRGVGVVPGDRVALLLANRSAYLELVFAAARIGAIAVPLNARLAAPEIRELLADCTPRVLVHESELEPLVSAACRDASPPPETCLAIGGVPDAWEQGLAAAQPDPHIEPVSPDDPMILMYTSGTTGIPKGALLPHRKALFNSLNAQLFFELTARDRVLVVVPLFHSFGLKILSIPALYAGATLVLQRHFDPEAVWRAVERHRISYLGGVPTMFRALDAVLAEQPDRFALGSLRFLFTAGAAIPVEVIHAFERRGMVLKQGFGQTETSILCCLDAQDAIRKAGSVGRPVFHAEVRLIRPDSFDDPPKSWREAPPGMTGEIVVRGPITMLGYWQRPEASAETLREDWLRTGDLATRDEEGFFTLTGRARDLFISGGENVYPAQIEAVYREHPAVRDIAVVGVPDERWGEVGRAHVVLAEGARLDPDALRAWGRARLAVFKVPRSYVEEKELPRTVTGKVQKHRLLERDAP